MACAPVWQMREASHYNSLPLKQPHHHQEKKDRMLKRHSEWPWTLLRNSGLLRLLWLSVTILKCIL